MGWALPFSLRYGVHMPAIKNLLLAGQVQHNALGS